ncbi:MAG: Hsp20/alpha crystallin family protein, partial [Bdellovibrionota bacterium]
PRSRQPAEGALWAPNCELSEDKECYVARFEIPGVPKDQIKVELRDNQLTVRAERRAEKKEEKKHYSEFSYGSFMRSFPLPTPVSEEKVNAAYDGGILTVTMQKTTPSGVRQISVK